MASSVIGAENPTGNGKGASRGYLVRPQNQAVTCNLTEANRISACSFSEEHKCDASLTKQLLPRLHMLDSIFCSSASQYVIIRIRSMISTCSVAVNYRLHIKVPQPVTTKHAGTRSSSLSGDTNCHTQKVIHPLPD